MSLRRSLQCQLHYHTHFEALHRRGHEAFARGDRNALAQIIGENTLWHTAGKSPVSGDYQGRESVFGFFDRLAEGAKPWRPTIAR